MTFERLKALLTAAPVLAFPDFERPFILETDASTAQVQRDGSIRPIAFASRTLQLYESRYGITELEGSWQDGVWPSKNWICGSSIDQASIL